ncbi:MAG: hypothetical protein IT438_16840 [Phycisphaerales bacterium]|nr:hypothetical protein [Phycisphaerales bacterium]
MAASPGGLVVGDGGTGRDPERTGGVFLDEPRERGRWCMVSRMVNTKVLTGMCLAAAVVTPTGALAQCQTDWAQHLPSARIDADMAFDAARGKVVLFGGFNSPAYRGDTWEYDCATGAWRLAATGGPPARRGAKLVYDSNRRRTLMIGGFASPALSGVQTWAWDGGTWREIDSSGPAYTFTASAAQEMAVAFNPSNGHVTAYLINGETWDWDGSVWRRAATTGPGTRRGMAMAYDRSGARIILFGGTVSGSPRNDTWAWDGVEWRQLAPAASPTVRSDHRMAYDSVGQRVLLYGGLTSGSARVRDTWSFNGLTWSQINNAGPATVSGGQGNCMAYDSTRRRLVLTGGSTNGWTDITEFDGSAWMATEQGPSARTGAASAYDAARGRLVLFGGLGSARLGDTWEFDGAKWALVSTSGPAARSESAMAYDPVRRRVVLFGGTGTALLNDTWEWDGSTWQRNNITGPTARERHAMCYDPLSGQIMLEGGTVGGNEMWFYNGSAWTRSVNGPTRAGHAMVFHPGTGMMILYGGSGGGTGQTAWGWNGTTWMAVGGPGPSTAIEHSLTLDPGSGQVVMFGPSASDAASWIFDGLTWRRVPTISGGPRARNNQCAWFDPQRGGLMLFGGTAAGGSNRETWEYRGIAGPRLARAATWTVSCDSGTARFDVETANVAGAPAITSVVWTRNGSPLADGPTGLGSTIATTSTPAASGGTIYGLTISGTGFADTGDYRCTLTTECGGVTTTNPARLSICPADFNCSGTGSGDGVTEQDIFDFLAAYFNRDRRADTNKDGIVAMQDLFEFLQIYFRGC